MENVNVRIENAIVDECSQSPTIRNIELIIETLPNITFNIDEPQEHMIYNFNRDKGEPANLINKSIIIDYYRVTESSQFPLIENMRGTISLSYSNDQDDVLEIKNIEFDLSE